MGFTHFTGVDAGQLKIDGTLLTVTAAELNAMSGGGLSAVELGYLDGAVAGTQAADKVVVPDTNINIGVTKVTELHIGTSGSEIQVLASQPAAIADYTITWTANTPTPGDSNTIDDGATVGDDNEGGQAIADITAKLNAILAALRTTGIIAT